MKTDKKNYKSVKDNFFFKKVSYIPRGKMTLLIGNKIHLK